MVVVNRSRQRPGLIMHSIDTVPSDTRKSDSSSSFKKDGVKGRKSCRVCFATDYNSSDAIREAAPEPLTDQEKTAAFYTPEDMKKFDKDRALTALVYQTRKSSGAPWDDNIDSLRGLEEITQQKKNTVTRRQRLLDHRRAVLTEQRRLRGDAGQMELAFASKAIKKPMDDLFDELVRGVSCSLSKTDKQRAINLGSKDERASANFEKVSGRKLLKKVKSKLSIWTSASNKSLLNGYSSCDDDDL